MEKGLNAQSAIIINRLTSRINNAIISSHVELRINHLTEQQHYTFNNKHSLQHKLSQYLESLSTESDPQFISETFSLFIRDLDQYVLLISEALYMNTDYKMHRKLHYNVLINKLLHTLFTFQITVNHKQRPLIYAKKLMTKHPPFREFMYSYHHGDGLIRCDKYHGISIHFQKQYHYYLTKYGILYLNELDLSKTMAFQNGWKWILSHKEYITQKLIEGDIISVINEICGLTVVILMQNSAENELSLSDFIVKIEEYYGYFESSRVFLCFYCTKCMTKLRLLMQHLTEFHELCDTEIDDTETCDTDNMMDRISYLMLIKLFKQIHIMYSTYYKNMKWRTDDILRKYIHQLNIINTANKELQTDTMNELNKLEKIEYIMHNTKKILSPSDNTSLSLSSIPSYSEFESLPFNSKRAMITAHYIARKLHSYFKRYHYCAESEENYIAILDHIYIVGGAIRNYLMNDIDINDIDIVVDTLKIQYLQSKHLLEYHELDENNDIINWNIMNCDENGGKKINPTIWGDTDYGLSCESLKYIEWISQKRRNCKCLWYLQFCKSINNKYNEIGGFDWIFNAKILSRILLNEMKHDFGSKKNAFSVFIDQNRVVRFQIRCHIFLYGIDIYGQSIDIADTSSHSPLNKGKKCNLNESKQRYPSYYKRYNDYFYYNAERGIWIQLLKKGIVKRKAMHPFTLKNDIYNRDLTINSLLLPLSAVLTKQQCFKWNEEDIIDFVSGKDDIKKRILCVCAQSTVYSILYSSPIRLLRVLKYYLKFNQVNNGEWIVDDLLKESIICNSNLLNNISCAALQYFVMPLLHLYSDNKKKTKLLLSTLDEYHLTEPFIKMITKDIGFCKHFLNVIYRFNGQVQSVYQEYKYPSIFSVKDKYLPYLLKQKKKNIIHPNFNRTLCIIDSLLKHFNI